MNDSDLDTLRMVRDMLWEAAGYKQFQVLIDALAELDALIARLSSEKLVSERSEQARMEQNTCEGIAPGWFKDQVKKAMQDIDNWPAWMKEAAGYFSTAPAASDVDELVGKIDALRKNSPYSIHYSWYNYAIDDVRTTIRAHFNAAWEKHHG